MRAEKGFSLIEVLIALTLVSVTVLAFMSELQTTTQARALSQTSTTAENLASDTMETVQAEPYVPASNGGVASYSVVSAPSNFTISSLDRNNNPVDGVIDGVPWNTATNTAYVGNDPNIQQITVIIKFDGKEVLRLKDYKVDVSS